MVLIRARGLAVALVVLGAATSAAQRGARGGGAGATEAGIGPRGSDGPRPLLFGFALECVNCRVTGRGGRVSAGGGGRGTGPLGVWHYDEYPRIAAIVPGSAAQLAGIREGDVLLSVDGLSLLTDEGAQRFGELRLGDTVHLTLDRNGKSIGVDLVLKRTMGRGGFGGAVSTTAPANAPSFTTRSHGTRVDIWSDSRVVESTDSTGATILKIGSTTIRLAGDSPTSSGRGRGGRGGSRGGPPTQ
jgi:membrane-associated protease RseP (regulator of RpoE activity)